jgi:uncharacterized protein YodC (DUF2158 family)
MSKFFSVGDFVRLMIGGETMVIVKSDALQTDHWICSWVDSKGQLQRSSIDQDLLKYVAPSNSGAQVQS